MQNLNNVKKLTENGKYKLVGFMLVNTPKKEQEDIILGTVINFFKDENNNFYFVENTSIKDYSVSQPYGIFQPHISKFNSNFEVVNENGVLDIFDKAIRDAENSIVDNEIVE